MSIVLVVRQHMFWLNRRSMMFVRVVSNIIVQVRLQLDLESYGV